MFLARAPSNIALVKYMGKRPGANLPENPSLSMTLHDLCSWVRAERVPGESRWVAEPPRVGLAPPTLSPAGAAKVLQHVARVRAALPGVFAAEGLSVDSASFGLELRTANTFPEASGIASSASSFAAITLATAAAGAERPREFAAAFESSARLKRALAALSRAGSGSSCRSFEGPWVSWDGEHASAVDARLPELAHFVILVSREAKLVSSSEAHARVKGSPLWSGRVERATARHSLVRGALAQGDWSLLAREVRRESWEMHSLFHTAEEPFTYWKPGSLEALQWLDAQVGRFGAEPFTGKSVDRTLSPSDFGSEGSNVPKSDLPADSPIVTMDAGPNVHVIVPAAESSQWRSSLIARFGADKILSDRPGRGAELVEF